MFKKAKERFKNFGRYIRSIGNFINEFQQRHSKKPVQLLDYAQKAQSDELFNEIKDIKKAIRRQGISMEVIRNDIIERINQKNLQDLQPFIDLTDNFFFLSDSFRQSQDLSAGQEEAMEIVWQKLEAVLSLFNIEVIRDISLPFDPVLHEAVGNVCSQTDGEVDNPVVERVL
ncbi:MAG: nucleotide exchange factor GrpE [Nitrospirae bacterium]|nr:nucleotide exchange factor GrpE [Nitrospirota bacterium]